MKRVLKKLSLSGSSRNRAGSNERNVVRQEAATNSSIPVGGTEVVAGPSVEVVSNAGEYGLFQLSSSPQNNEDGEKFSGIDIVAIHGLNGDAHQTWTHKNGNFWLRDLLPWAMPGARIFTYGYPSQVLFSRSIAGIRDYAIKLLTCLINERANDEKQRLIIYVCHSLGGIVFKEAMLIAYEEDRFHPIWLCSKAVIFMGTPHRGSDSASLGKVLGSVFNVVLQASGTRRFTGVVRTALLRDLNQESPELVRIADSFIRKASGFRIVSFYETEVTPILNEIIVGQSSAVIGIPHEDKEPLWANHQDLCRFSGENDQNYRAVSKRLIRIGTEIMPESNPAISSLNTDKSYDETEKACISLLNTTDVAGHESSLERRVDGTLQWLLTDHQYQSWISSAGTRLLWVTGYAGCGKTIMASYIMKHLRAHLPPRAIVCRFFCDYKVKELRDPNELLKSLIFQVINRRRRLAGDVKRASDAGGFQIFQQFDALWNLFIRLCRDKRVTSISVIIDAIDECDDKAQSLLIDRISELLGSDHGGSLKFFITSRPNMAAGVRLGVNEENIIRLQLEEQQDKIAGDVKLVVRQRLETLVKKDTFRNQTREFLEDIFLTKADRTFLWVAIMLSLAEKRGVISLPEARTFANQIPPDLETLYDHLLDSIRVEERESAGRMLRILMASNRPLNSDELGLLLTIKPEHRSMASLGDENLEYDARIAQKALGPLIRVLNSVIEPIHLSLKNYLVSLSMKPEHPLAGVFGVNLVKETLNLASICVQYLSFEEFSTDLFARSVSPDHSSPISPLAPVESIADDSSSLYVVDLYDDPIFKDNSVIEAEKWTQVAASYKLFDYAAKYWADDFAACNDVASSEQHDSAIAICGDNSGLLADWFRYFWITSGITAPYPSEVNALIITAYFGQAKTLERLLGRVTYKNEKVLGSALYWAARQGHAKCLRLLLEGTDINPQYCIEGQSSLAAAAQFCRMDCISLLFENVKTDVNIRDWSGRTPLSLAAANGHAQAVALFLSRDDILVDLADTTGATPFFWARSIDIVRQFMADDRVNKNYLDNKGRNVVSWAAEDGLLDLVNEFSKFISVNLGQGDKRGRSPLIYAVQGGHLEVVRSLIKSKRVSIAEEDNDGRNAISWAASQPNYSLLRFLLKHGRSSADAEDENGWTPLSWALNPPGYPENISSLIQSGVVDINRKDRVNAQSALSWAACYGHTRIVRELTCSPGIDLETRNSGGRTPLSNAAGAGSLEIVQLLMEMSNVDVNSRDNSGRTPLAHAASQGQRQVIALLLADSRVDVAVRDHQGRLPQDFARAYGYEQAAQDIESHVRRP